MELVNFGQPWSCPQVKLRTEKGSQYLRSWTAVLQMFLLHSTSPDYIFCKLMNILFDKIVQSNFFEENIVILQYFWIPKIKLRLQRFWSKSFLVRFLKTNLLYVEQRMILEMSSGNIYSQARIIVFINYKSVFTFFQ